MGRSYYVPRSAKGESRILYIFSVKSLVTTLVCGLIGFGIASMVSSVIEMSIITEIIFIAPFAAIGYGIGALKIPDVPLMGPLQKAGGEQVLDILFRIISFGPKKKIYIYGIDRKLEKKQTKIQNNAIKIADRGNK